MLDVNNNLKPDDEPGDTHEIELDFNSDGSLAYTLNGETQNVTWNFELDETVVRIIGLEFDSIISVSNEFDFPIYHLNESSLIFQGTTVSNPEQLTFYVFGK